MPTVKGIIFISIAMLAAGLLIGTFGLGGLTPVEATVPSQATDWVQAGRYKASGLFRLRQSVGNR